MPATDNAQEIVNTVESKLKDTSNNGHGHTVEAAQALQEALEHERAMHPDSYKALIQAVDQQLINDGVLPDIAVGWAKLHEQELFTGIGVSKDDLIKYGQWSDPNDVFRKEMVNQLSAEFDKLNPIYDGTYQYKVTDQGLMQSLDTIDQTHLDNVNTSNNRSFADNAAHVLLSKVGDGNQTLFDYLASFQKDGHANELTHADLKEALRQMDKLNLTAEQKNMITQLDQHWDDACVPIRDCFMSNMIGFIGHDFISMETLAKGAGYDNVDQMKQKVESDAPATPVAPVPAPGDTPATPVTTADAKQIIEALATDPALLQRISDGALNLSKNQIDQVLNNPSALSAAEITALQSLSRNFEELQKAGLTNLDALSKYVDPARDFDTVRRNDGYLPTTQAVVDNLKDVLKNDPWFVKQFSDNGTFSMESIWRGAGSGQNEQYLDRLNLNPAEKEALAALLDSFHVLSKGKDTFNANDVTGDTAPPVTTADAKQIIEALATDPALLKKVTDGSLNLDKDKIDKALNNCAGLSTDEITALQTLSLNFDQLQKAGLTNLDALSKYVDPASNFDAVRRNDGYMPPKQCEVDNLKEVLKNDPSFVKRFSDNGTFSMPSILQGAGSGQELNAAEKEALATLMGSFHILANGKDTFTAKDITGSPLPGDKPTEPPSINELAKLLHKELNDEGTVRRGEGYWHVAARLLDLDVQSPKHKDQVEIMHLAQLLEKINHNQRLYTGTRIKVFEHFAELMHDDPYFAKVMEKHGAKIRRQLGTSVEAAATLPDPVDDSSGTASGRGLQPA